MLVVLNTLGDGDCGPIQAPTTRSAECSYSIIQAKDQEERRDIEGGVVGGGVGVGVVALCTLSLIYSI